MGRSPCSDENGLKKGPWTPEEDQKLVKHIQIHGHGCWRALPKHAGLNRCGKSCRLRWTNYLRPDIKRGKFSSEEEQTILNLHAILGNKWSTIATHLPGRTDNEIKNFWNTHLKKKLIQMGFDPMTHQPRTAIFSNMPQLMALANLRDIMAYHTHYNQKPFEEHAVRLEAEAVQIAMARYLQCMLQSSNSCSSLSNISDMEAIAMLELASSTRPCVFEEETVMCNSYNFDNSSCSLAFSSSNSISSQSPVSSLQNMQILTHFQALDNPIVNSESNLDSSFPGLFHQEENTLKLPPFPPLNSSEDENYVSTLLETSTNSRYVASSFWPDMVLEEPFIHEIV